MLLSNLAWKKLLKAQNSLDKQKEATLAKFQTLSAKLLYLQKQQNLLKK
jgi:hypothetical protein